MVTAADFAVIAQLEIHKAVRLHYAFSLLAVLLDPEEGEIQHPRRLAAEVAHAISPVIRQTDLIGRPSRSASLHVLLVPTSYEAVPAIVHRIRDESSRHLYRIDGARRAVTLSIGWSCFPTTAITLQDLFAQADAQAEEARRHRRGPSDEGTPR